MGWVSLLEDSLERAQDSIRLAESALKKDERPSEGTRRICLKALNDARTTLAQAWKHLDLATNPELDLAHQNVELSKQVDKLTGKLGSAQRNTEKAELEAATRFAELQDANRDIKRLRKDMRKLEKDFEKLAQSDFESAVKAYSSSGRLKKYKPKA